MYTAAAAESPGDAGGGLAAQLSRNDVDDSGRAATPTGGISAATGSTPATTHTHTHDNSTTTLLRCQPAIAKVHYSQSLSQRRLGLALGLVFGYSGLQLLLLLYYYYGLFSTTSWVSRYEKIKTSLDLNVAREDGVSGRSGIAGPALGNWRP